MCDPVTLILGAVGAAGSLLTAKQKTPAPPPIPAVQAAPAEDSNADVRTTGDDIVDSAAPAYKGFAPKRTQAKTLGGLGASGLGL